MGGRGGATRSALAARYALLLLGALAALTGCLLLVGTIAEGAAAGDPLAGVDRDVARGLRERAAEPWTTLLRGLTHLGGAAVLGGVSLVAIGLGLWRALPEAALVPAAFVGAQLLTLALKAGFGRPRPALPDPLATAAWYSFPSGHASASAAVYGAIALLLARRLRSRAGRALVVVGCAALVAAIAFSRVYLGVHHLSDVVAGIAVGAAWLAAALLVHRLLTKA